MVFCTASPAAGTKLLNTKLTSVSRAGWNTGNTENIANTATVSGTSDTSVVYDSAPAVSKHLSSTTRCQMKRLKLIVRSRLKRRTIGVPWSAAWRRRQHRWYRPRTDENTSELQSLMPSSYAVFCLKNKTKKIKI